MILLLLNLINFIKAEQVFVILGGSSAANYNDYDYIGTNNNVFSYNGSWKIATNPMPGGDGYMGSPWAELGDKINKETNESVYFIDCARIGANILDWTYEGKYYQLSQSCFDIAESITNQSYNVLWMEGHQDNVYSFNSDIFINAISNMVRQNSNWYLSLFSYGNNSNFRWDKIVDIYELTNRNNNIYLGADIDGSCIESIPFSIEDNRRVVSLWYNSINDRHIASSPYKIYTICSYWSYNGGFILFFCIIISIILLCAGCFYSREYYERRRYYNLLTNRT